MTQIKSTSILKVLKFIKNTVIHKRQKNIFVKYNDIFNCSLNIKLFFIFFVSGMNKSVFEEIYMLNINRKK